jgi:hypothetical protein
MKRINYILSILLIFFILSLCTFLFSIIYTPLKQNSLKNIDLNLKDYQEQLKKNRIKEKELKEWNTVELSYLTGKQKYFMKFSEFSKFRNDLKDFFITLGLTEMGLKVGYKKISGGEFIRASIIFKISGSYKNIKKLIFKVLKIDKLVFIKKVTLKKKNDNMINGNFILEVILVP